VSAHRRVLTQVFGIKLAEPKTVKVKEHSRKANTPKREFLGMSAHARDEILAIADDYLGDGE